jgi:hypothetical protein
MPITKDWVALKIAQADRAAVSNRQALENIALARLSQRPNRRN